MHVKFPRERLESAFKGRSLDAIGPDWEDLEGLWRVALSGRCRSVLEYGSGCSTAVLGLAMVETGGRLVSLEGDLRWWQETIKIVEGLELWPWVMCIGCSYRREPGGVAFSAIGGEWDMIYVDGPPVEEGEVNAILSRSSIVVVDGREGTQSALESHLEGYDHVRDRDQGIWISKRRGRHRGAYRMLAGEGIRGSEVAAL